MNWLLGKRMPTVVQDVVLLLARIILGGVFVAHGWQKLTEFGLEGTGASFDQMGVPAPQAAATFAAVVELGAGAALLVGLLTPVAATLLALNMAGAWLFVHRGTEVFVADNGWELVGALLAGAVVIGAVGPGRLSVDRLIGGARVGATAAR
ncbi:DoxX family protein [Nocardioides sp.]|uniref:DoxX family protein n=1 Tax=Nocardioides sp. TaxID=35761 RepID=UPI0027353817|nr:DoxX family protein [Nocardioides sp.]MDP3894246.1 DoxX family protein [Nocardioides sp.]